MSVELAQIIQMLPFNHPAVSCQVDPLHSNVSLRYLTASDIKIIRLQLQSSMYSYHIEADHKFMLIGYNYTSIRLGKEMATRLLCCWWERLQDPGFTHATPAYDP